MPKITKIPATISRFTATPIDTPTKRQVAAYARVSTDNEEQLTSYAAQVSYYTDYSPYRNRHRPYSERSITLPAQCSLSERAQLMLFLLKSFVS